jgi:hypothetical protein
MIRRLSLQDLHDLVVGELDGEWTTPTEITDRLGVGNDIGWLRVALILERLATDGYAGLKMPGSRVRRFRRAA